MAPKRKESFINDKRRVSYLRTVYSRIYRGKSVLIEGMYGSGKTRFLQLLKPKKLVTVWLESLDNKHEILTSILQDLNYGYCASYRETSYNLKKICSISGFVILIDEANDLDRRVWPYFKRIIDAGIPMVFAGLPKVRTFLAIEHPDILSRLKILPLFPIDVENFILEYKDFDPEAIEQIYAATGGDMRKLEEVCTDCRDKAKELKCSIIDLNIALPFITEFKSNL